MTVLEEKEKDLELQYKLDSLKVKELFQVAYLFLYNIDSEWLARYSKAVRVLVTIFNHDFRDISKHQRDINASNMLEEKTSAKELQALICIVSYFITVISGK